MRIRDLYKCVDYKIIDWPNRDKFKENVTPERIVEEAKKAAQALPKGSPIRADQRPSDENIDFDNPSGIPDYRSLTEEDVVVDYSVFHHGKKELNPLDFIEFYSKRKPNGKKPSPLSHTPLLIFGRRKRKGWTRRLLQPYASILRGGTPPSLHEKFRLFRYYSSRISCRAR